MAGTQSLAHEAPRDGLGLGVDLGVGQLAIARHHRDAVRIEGRGSGENLAQQFVADEIGPFGAAQDGFPAKERSRAVAVRGKSFGYRKMRHICPCHSIAPEASMAWKSAAVPHFDQAECAPAH